MLYAEIGCSHLCRDNFFSSANHWLMQLPIQPLSRSACVWYVVPFSRPWSLICRFSSWSVFLVVLNTNRLGLWRSSSQSKASLVGLFSNSWTRSLFTSRCFWSCTHCFNIPIPASAARSHNCDKIHNDEKGSGLFCSWCGCSWKWPKGVDSSPLTSSIVVFLLVPVSVLTLDSYACEKVVFLLYNASGHVWQETCA